MQTLFLSFLFALSSITFAAEHPAIAKAQRLFLNSKRSLATQVLRDALLKEKTGTPTHKELSDTLREMSMRFLTDRGQKLFELGETLSQQNPKGAADRYREALAVEDNNTQALLALGLVLLAQQKCEEAEKPLNDAILEYPGYWEAQLLLAPTLLCLERTQEFSTQLSKLEKMEGVPKWWVKYYRARFLFNEEQPLAAKALFENIRTEEKSFPESYYWIWSLEKDSVPPLQSSAQRYVRICKNLSSKIRGQFKYEPNLCRETEKVDVWLKAHSAQ